jgi:putative photosynthetic complex assembly protein
MAHQPHAEPDMNTRASAAPLAPDSFPRWVLLCAGGVMALSLISVAAVRLTGNGPDQLAAAAAAKTAATPFVASKDQRALRFEDRPDGSIAVLDGVTGQAVASIQGEQGFLRGALRALARERKSRGLGAQTPFLLTARSDGGLTLFDPVTGQRVDLESFGPSNAGVFAPLLTAPARP